MCYSGCPYERKMGKDRVGECIGMKSWEKTDAYCYISPEYERTMKARYDANYVPEYRKGEDDND